jgi:hypothetical protein
MMPESMILGKKNRTVIGTPCMLPSSICTGAFSPAQTEVIDQVIGRTAGAQAL